MNVPGQHRGKGRGAWGLSGGLATRRPVAHHEQQLRNTAITKRKRNHISFFYEKLRNYGNERKVRILAADSGGSVTSTVFTERLGGSQDRMPCSARIEATDDIRRLFGDKVTHFQFYADKSPSARDEYKLRLVFLVPGHKPKKAVSPRLLPPTIAV